MEKVLIVGSGELGIDCYKRIYAEANLLGLKLAGLCGDEKLPESDENNLIPYLGKISSRTNIIEKESIVQIYLALEPKKQQETLSILQMLDRGLVNSEESSCKLILFTS